MNLRSSTLIVFATLSGGLLSAALAFTSGDEKTVSTFLPSPLSDQDVDHLVAFLNALTDPSAADCSEIIPTEVPSGLPPPPSRAN